MHARPALAPLLLLTLAACSGEPGEAEMRTLVEAHMRRGAAGTGQAPFPGFTDFRKQGCVEAKDARRAYDCYYQATVPPAGAAGRGVTVNGKGRFAAGDRGFVFTDLGAQPK